MSAVLNGEQPLLLSQHDLDPLVSSREELARAVDLVADSLTRESAGQVVLADLALENGNAMTLMSATVAGGATVRMHPEQWNTGSTENAWLLTLLDPTSGALRCLCASAELNHLRTAVPAGMGARYLASPDAQVLGILGCGNQARHQANVIRSIFPGLTRILLWNRTQANAQRFADEQGPKLGIEIEVCGTAEEAVAGADVVAATMRLRGQPAYQAEWVKPGALMIDITGSAPPDLRGTARLIVPARDRAELVAFGGRPGKVPATYAPDVVDLRDVIDGRQPARLDSDQIVIWSLVNVYLFDIPLAQWAYSWASARGVGTPLAL